MQIVFLFVWDAEKKTMAKLILHCSFGQNYFLIVPRIFFYWESEKRVKVLKKQHKPVASVIVQSPFLSPQLK